MPGIALTGEDYAKNPALSVTALASFLRDIDFQPSWRARADVDADYYDSNQYDSRTLQLMEERGIPPIVINLIAPTINLVLGMEEKTRRDWIVRADNDKDVDFALAMTQKLQEAERASYADKACSDAYAGQVKAGLHWVHVRKQRRDPYAYPYVVEGVHRREIWWDWHDQDPLLRNARWLVRRKWYDLDVVEAQFPEHAELLAQIVAGWNLFEDRSIMDVGHPLYQDWLSQRDFHWGVDEWRNLDRRRLALYEVWYRAWGKMKPLLVMQDGQIFDIDPNEPDPMRQQATAMAIQQGLGEVQFARAPEMRLSYWVGPHRLTDIPSPLPHRDFPYVPFWGYREDRTGVPYGHIRAMRPMQDEVNARRARMLWQLSAKRLIGFEEGVKDKKAIELEAARPDAAIWLNMAKAGGRTLEQMLRIDDNQALNEQQIAAYEDAKITLQDVSNTFKEQLGKSDAATSGIAISQLIEQGTLSLAELNSNYQFARTEVGNQLFSHVKADTNKPTEMTVKKGMGATKKVVLNQRKFDEEIGREVTSNSVALLRAKVVIDDAPQSSTYRQYLATELTNLAKGLPNPQLQAAVLDMVIMSSDLPYREEIAERVRSALGIEKTDTETMSEDEKAAFMDRMEAKELTARLREEMALLAKERADLENRKIDAETELTEAKTEVEKTKVGQMDADTKHTAVETDRLKREPIVDKSQVNPGIDPKKAQLRDVA